VLPFLAKIYWWWILKNINVLYAGFPFNYYKKCHWYLAVVCAKLFEVHVLDSMGLLMFDRDDLKKIVSNYVCFVNNRISSFLFWFLVFSKEWVRSNTPYPISITLRTIRDILDPNKLMYRDCFNMVVRTVACNIARLLVEEKYHFMDLQFCVSWYQLFRCCLYNFISDLIK
jgi:hypothetical protein